MHTPRCDITAPLPFTLVAPLPGEQTQSSAALITVGGLSRADALWVNVEPGGQNGPFVVVILRNAGEDDVRLSIGGIPTSRILSSRDVETVLIDNAGLGPVNAWIEAQGGYSQKDRP